MCMRDRYDPLASDDEQGRRLEVVDRIDQDGERDEWIDSLNCIPTFTEHAMDDERTGDREGVEQRPKNYHLASERFLQRGAKQIRIVAQTGETRDGQARCGGTKKTQSFGDTDGEPDKSHSLGADESPHNQWIHQR